MKTLTGYEAIEAAEREGLTLSKYADPTEDARTGLSVEEAREIAKEDPSLIWLARKGGQAMAKVRCQCGDITGTPCEWTGPLDETVVVEYMPEYLRSSHVAAGNSGSYPHNGAQRARVERSCADVVTHVWVDGTQTDEPAEWVSLVSR